MRKIFIGFCLVLTGCMVGPNYQKPVIDIPHEYMYESKEARGSLNVKWWEQFDDQVLTHLIEEALLYNKDIQIALENIQASIAIMIQVRSPLFPQIGYASDVSRTKFSDNALFAPTIAPVAISKPFNNFDLLGSASFEIDLFGRTRRLVESAQASIAASYQAKQATILSLVASVANNYLMLRGLDEQLHIAMQTKDSYAEEVHYFEKQFKYGQTAQISVAQSNTQYEQAAAAIPQIKTQIAKVENALSILLGSNPRQIPRGKSIYDLKMPVIPEGIPSELLYQRPDILQAEYYLIQANAEIGAAKALYFPSISLTGYFGVESLQLSNLFTGPSRTWNYTGSLLGPLFTGGNIYGQVAQAKAQEQAALYAYQQTIQSAFADVENALIAHTMLLNQMESVTLLVKAAGQYQYLAELQYKGGYSPYFVVIQAQEQYFPAQLSWAKTRANMFSSMVNIYQALGGGWVSLAAQE
jgi:outer membrane protein, multidrug efflux system